MTPEQFSSTATAWLSAIGIVLTGVLGLAAVVLPKLASLKAQFDALHLRQEAQSGRLNSQDNRINQIALAAPPPAPLALPAPPISLPPSPPTQPQS